MNGKFFLLACWMSLAVLPSLFGAEPFDYNATANSRLNHGIKTYAEISQDVRNAIAADSSLATYSQSIIVVTTANGKVTLSGTVDTAQQRTDIEAITRSVSGVNIVVNNIWVLSDFSQ